LFGSSIPAIDQEIAMLNVRTLHVVLHGHEGDLARRTEVLGRIVLDLLMEVEALRKAVKELSDRAGTLDEGDDILSDPRHGVPGPRTAYAAAYGHTAWLTHCAVGLSDGWEKLLAEYYTWDAEPSEWRECLMLKRLGFSDADIATYMESARQAELFT
jgi:hypothetical protein